MYSSAKLMGERLKYLTRDNLWKNTCQMKVKPWAIPWLRRPRAMEREKNERHKSSVLQNNKKNKQFEWQNILRNVQTISFDCVLSIERHFPMVLLSYRINFQNKRPSLTKCVTSRARQLSSSAQSILSKFQAKQNLKHIHSFLLHVRH